MTTATRRPLDRPSRRSGAGWIAIIIFATLAALGLLGAVAVIGGYMALSANLSDPARQLTNLPIPEESIVYDRTGQIELARFGDIKRENVAFDDIPPILLDATTAVEDKTFWSNAGFDPASIVAAGLDAIRGNARGASTITQQLVRQRLLEPELVQAQGRTIERKLKEIIQSIRLTQRFSGEGGKQEIIAAYLNQNYYGNNSYGVKAAAQSYFGKALADLSLGEVALLAALPQSPSSYDLVRNAVEQGDQLVVPPDTDIVRRRNLVLDLLAEGRTPMSQDEYTAADFEAAKDEPVVVIEPTEDIWTAPHFVWQVRDELTDLICTEDAETCDEMVQGGFRITTTLDVELQEAAERWVRLAARTPKASDPAGNAETLGFDELPAWVENLIDKDLNNGALVALDYQTGELVAYVGSASYYSRGESAKFQTKFDVVGNGWRQPGSAFKPISYVTGLDEQTMTAGTMFMDVATDFGGGYTPSNADNLERGPVRLRQALQFSLNIPAVKAMAVNKVEFVFNRAQDYGVRWRENTTDAGLGFALGVEEIRPIDLVTAYGTIANSGRYTGHTTILQVTNRDGSEPLPLRERPEGEQVLSPQAAGIMTDILAGNTNPDVNPFWGRFAIPGRQATLKTGTNNDAKDLNAYGYVPPPTEEGRAAGEYALAVGVWNGNSDNTVVSSPDDPLFSIDVSTYVWQGFLTQATEGWTTGTEFVRPDGLTSAEVDPWVGILPAPGQRGVSELFIEGTQPEQRVGREDGVCGMGILEQVGYERSFDNWMAADRDWLQRARRGPGVSGGPEGTRTSYFYNNSFNPFGRSWGPLLQGAGCGTPAPSPTCFPLPAPDASGNIPSFEPPQPSGSGPAPLPCPTETPTESPSASPSVPPSEEPIESLPPPPTPPPPPTEEPTPPPPAPTEPPPAPSEPPPAVEPSTAGGDDTGGGTEAGGGAPAPSP